MPAENPRPGDYRHHDQRSDDYPVRGPGMTRSGDAPSEPIRGSLFEVLSTSLRLGLTSFGGPIAHLGYFRREYVERRRWLDEDAYADLVALCQSLPGPASSQLGIAIGTRRAGMIGGFVAWVGFTLPSAVALVLFGLWTGPADLAAAGWVHGLKIAAVAVVAQAVWAMARTLAPDLPRRAMAVAAAAAALLWPGPFIQVLIIGAGGLMGRIALAPARRADAHAEPAVLPRRIGVLCLALFFGLLLGLPFLHAVTGDAGVGRFDGFYRAGALVFGGGHVVLPLLHTIVVDSGWVGDDRFLAGYGAAQAIPGPLFTFAAYLGAVSSAPPAGWAGAVIALTAIFLPSFLVIFGTLPFWDELRGSLSFRRALSGTNAAVVGLLLAALYTPLWTSAILRPVDLLLVGLAVGLLVPARLPPFVVVAVCAVGGQLVGP